MEEHRNIFSTWFLDIFFRLDVEKAFNPISSWEEWPDLVTFILSSGICMESGHSFYLHTNNTR